MGQVRYFNGDEVKIGDIVDVGHGSGPRMRVVVIIPSNKAAEGFNAVEWAYLESGIVLQDTKVFGLLYIEELSQEHILVERV